MMPSERSERPRRAVALTKRAMLRSADRLLGSVGASLLSMHRRVVRREEAAGQGKPPAKLLLTKLVGLGDMVLLLTVLKRIRAALPRAEIHFLATPASAPLLTENCPYVDRVRVEDILKWRNPLSGMIRLGWALRKEGYDAAVDLEQHFQMTPILLYLAAIPRRLGFYYHASRAKLFTDPIRLSPRRHMLSGFWDLTDALLGDFRPAPQGLVPPVLTRENRRRAQEWLSANGIGRGPYVVIHPGCGPSGLCRRWPGERFAEVAVRLARRGFAILVSGAPEEKPVVDSILAQGNGTVFHSLVGELPLYDYAALLDRASLLLACDTGPMHLGTALRVPTLGLFGPENPERYRPYGRGNAYLYVKQPCSPCNHNYKGIRPRCTNGIYQKCMREISVDRVEAASLRLLQRARRREMSPIVTRPAGLVGSLKGDALCFV